MTRIRARIIARNPTIGSYAKAVTNIRKSENETWKEATITTPARKFVMTLEQPLQRRNTINTQQ
jgi:hypothetical protein